MADFDGYWECNATITSNARDGFTVDINGTEVLFIQRDKHIPILYEVWVEDEPKPLGSINVARGETVTLGGVEEGLTDEVARIRELPVEEVSPALEKLEHRLNPTGVEAPQTDPDTSGGNDD